MIHSKVNGMYACRMCQLYRHYSADGSLLYIGIAFSALSRAMSHRSESPWWREVARIEIENFNSRAEAEKAEAAAIKISRPIYNVVHNNRKPLRSDELDSAFEVLTDEKIGLIVPDAVRREHAVVPGIGLYVAVHPSGKKTFVYRYRDNGRPCKLTIGKWPQVTARQARSKAFSLRAQSEALHAVGD